MIPFIMIGLFVSTRMEPVFGYNKTLPFESLFALNFRNEFSSSLLQTGQ